MLRGKVIFLRALEIDDADMMLKWENNSSNWRISGTKVPFSRQSIIDYIMNAQDIFTVKQVRLVICLVENNKAVGSVDLFDYDPIHQHAGVGILIENEYREKGIGLEALNLVSHYALNAIGIRNLECNILSNNKPSQRLFEKAGYVEVGCKKKWFNNFGDWLDQYNYQKELLK